jgi:hypothetical protein
MAPPPPLTVTANSSPFWLPRGMRIERDDHVTHTPSTHTWHIPPEHTRTQAYTTSNTLFGTLRPPIKIQRYGPKYSELATRVLMIRQTKPGLVFAYGDIRLHSYENWLQSVRQARVFHVHGDVSSQLTACSTHHVHPAADDLSIKESASFSNIFVILLESAVVFPDSKKHGGKNHGSVGKPETHNYLFRP